MIETLSAPGVASGEGSWERFEALYRSSRSDLYAYVATLLRDPAAAEDVTALAFERAYRSDRYLARPESKRFPGRLAFLGRWRAKPFAIDSAGNHGYLIARHARLAQ